MDQPVNDETVSEEPEVEETEAEETELVDDDPDQTEGVDASAPEEALARTKRIREYPVELSVGDGRTIDARIVPYNTPAEVADPPFFVPYKEEFLPGAFDKQMRAADRVKIWLNFEHEQGLRGVVGHGVALENDGNFLRGSFRVHDNADGDKALQLVNEGLLTGLSAEFVPMKSQRSAKGVVQRMRAHLDRVSLCRFPAYKDAQVVAVRTKPVLNEIVVPAASPELTEKVNALGVRAIGRVAVTKQRWNPAPDKFTDEEYAASCLIDQGGDDNAKDRCYLPVLEPDGTLNINALEHAALLLQRRGVPNATPRARQDAARLLIRYYRAARQEAPESMQALARGKAVPTYTPLRRGSAPKPVVAPSVPLERAVAPAEQKAVGRLDMLIATAKNYIADEPDPADKATMGRILGMLQSLRNKDMAEGGQAA